MSNGRGQLDQGSRDSQITEEDSWTVIDSYFEENGIVSQQINSFNNFLDNTLQEIVEEVGKISVKPGKQYRPSRANEYEDRTYELNFQQLHVYHKPTFRAKDRSTSNPSPAEARLRNLTYEAEAFMDVQFNVYTTDDNGNQDVIKTENFSKLPIGKIPIMVRSKYCALNGLSAAERVSKGECPLDPGGYFIVKGGEKAVVAQERIASNFVYVFKNRNNSLYSWEAEIRSYMERSNRPNSKFAMMILKQNSTTSYTQTSDDFCGNFQPIRCSIRNVNRPVPVVILFRALGIESDKEIFEQICYDLKDTQMMELLTGSFKEASNVLSTESAKSFIGAGKIDKKSDRIKFADIVLQKELLPHLGTDEASYPKKALFIGYMVNRICNSALERTGEDDRDHYGKKRLDMVGILMSNLFRSQFVHFTKSAKEQFVRAIESKNDVNAYLLFHPDTITHSLRHALATGNWGITGTGEVAKHGVAQALSRMTYTSTLSHLRRINTPLKKTGKIAKPRQLHNTHWGVICPAETPEGASCGLVKNIALMAYVSVGRNSLSIEQFLLNSLKVEPLDSVAIDQIPTKTKIFVNGNWIGLHDRGDHVIDTLKSFRRRLKIPYEVSILQDITNKEIKIYTDAGRIQRPLYIVENSELKLKKSDVLAIRSKQASFNDLLARGAVEFLDIEEEETAMISMYIKNLSKTDYCSTYTHCEIHPAMILGISASCIPFPDHNQSPRNTYQSAMGKQAMGIYTTNFNIRMDTLGHILYYSQKPLVETRAMQILNCKELPQGCNSVVAIMCFTGYNQEDSIIFNQSAIDRGFMRSVFYRTYTDEVDIEEQKAVSRTRNSTMEVCCIPPKNFTENVRMGTYSKLDTDGIIIPGKRVTGGDSPDILVGKILVPLTGFFQGFRRDSLTKYKDVSLSLRHNEAGIVDQVMITQNHEGKKLIKIKTRSIRVPQIGDKFASRHGQKGTIGMTYRTEDMPFTIEGLTPDLIINPHAIPSRMTVGHLVECLASKVACFKGSTADGSIFSDVTVEDISRELHGLGYQKYGNECVYNPFTGERVKIRIFFGPTYYQRLRHLVEDKIHARARGKLQNLNQQPTEGRSRDGGLRFGEMERDCMISHGAAKFLKEKLFEVSDFYRIFVCRKCGFSARANQTSKFECPRCKQIEKGFNTEIVEVQIPYACKLLIQELNAMQIAVRFKTDMI